MEKTYQEQAVAFLLKAVIGLGSVYLITEKFVGQIDHLFHLESIETALFWFHLIYFVSPIAVTCVYFFLKKGSMQLYNNRANPILAGLAGVYALFLVSAFFVPIFPFLFMGGGLMLIALTFICLCMFLRKTDEHKKQMFQYLSISFIIILFAFTYLIRNDANAVKFENKYFSDKASHFKVMNLVDDHLSSTANKFQPEPVAALDTAALRAHFRKAGQGKELKDADTNELIRVSRNRWGLYINLLSYKALLVVLPFAAVVIGFIFLLTTNQIVSTGPTVLKKKGEDYEVATPTAPNIPEKEFLKVVFVILITLVVPVLHPLETIKSTFSKPISFTEPPPIVKPPVTQPPGGDPPPLRGTSMNLEGYGEIIVLSPVNIDPMKHLVNRSALDSLKVGIEKINSNLLLFSQRFGPENANHSAVYFYPTKSLESNAFKNN